jgi:hypothetical protein
MYRMFRSIELNRNYRVALVCHLARLCGLRD